MAREPDGEEKAMRFGCGALVGIPFAVRITSVLRHAHWTTGRALLALVIVLGFGYVAMKRGDRFWGGSGW